MNKPVKQPKAPRALRQPGAAPKRASNNTNWLASLKVWQKLALIPLALLIPLAVVQFLLLQNQNADISFTQKELKGANYIERTVPLLELSSTLVYKVDQRTMDVAKLGSEFDRNLQSLSEIHSLLGAELGVEEQFQAVQKQWNQIKPKLGDRNTASEFVTLTTALNGLIDTVGINSNLKLDPDVDSYYLMTMVVQYLPVLIPSIGDLQGVGAQALRLKKFDVEQRLLLQSNISRIRLLREQIDQAFRSASLANPRVAESLGRVYDQSNSSGVNSSYNAQRMALMGGKEAPSVDGFEGLLERTKSNYASLQSEANVVLKGLLSARIERLSSQRNLTFVIALVALALAAFIVFAIAREITHPIAQLSQASSRLAKGQFDLELRVKSQDELGQLALGLQQAADQLQQSAAQQETERMKGVQLQDNVNKFLTVATEIAQGDFTKRGDVTDDVLGNVVDAINLMTEEVSYLLKDVQKAADSVSSGAQQVNGLTDSIAQGALAQADEVQQVRERTLQAADTIRQMAERAAQSVQQAQQTLEAAQLGREAVVETLAGMQDIRMEMQGIAENIRAFLVRSQEINSIAKTLEDFASQTNLLALNASFEAAGAGVAGKRFAVVAEEIRRLAESSARETGRVGALVQQIQGDINAVVSRTQDGVREVENSYRIANTADERLEEIARLAGRTTQAAEQISKLAEGQVAVVEGVEQAVEKIASTAQRSEAESVQGREAAETMRRLSEQLSNNLGRFKLSS